MFLILAAALLLDAALGEPRWLWDRLPHPAVLMGRAVTWCDRTLNHGADRRRNGVLAVIFLVLLAGGIGAALSALGTVVTLVVAAILLAQRSLIDHVRAVADGLRKSDGDGKHAVSMIVSRDMGDASSSSVSRAAIESLAENFSDGVVAPAFWFAIAGLPGILIYKMVNTADSMIGYRTERYADFGRAAARLDDLLNWVPARLTALLLAVIGGSTARWSVITADARLHRSPNAGWPEAALAHAQNIALAGPRSYDGQMQDLAWVNLNGTRDLGPGDIDAACAIVWKAWGVMVAIVLVIGVSTWAF